MSGTATKVLAVPPRHIVGNAEVRKICGGVTRHTILAWRKGAGFPEPIRVLRASRVELWDAREVRSWLGARRRAGH